MSVWLRSLLTSGVVAFLLGVSATAALPASAQAADPSCAPADQAQVTAVFSADGSEATFTVGNALPLCEPMAIGLAVYLKDADGFVVPQSLADSATGMITTGSMTLSITAPADGKTPRCFTQVDAFTGSPLAEITDTEQYGTRLLAYQFGQVTTCAEVEAESTTTSSSTSTTMHTSVTQPPADIEGTQVTRAPTPVTVQSQPLARTGPSSDVGLFVVAGGLLLMFGGFFLAWGNRPG